MGSCCFIRGFGTALFAAGILMFAGPLAAEEPAETDFDYRATLIVRTAHTMVNRIHNRRDRVKFFGSRYKHPKYSLGRPVKFDDRQHFHPTEPSTLVVECKGLKDIGAWYFLNRTAVKARAFTVEPTYRWTIRDQSGETRSREHTHTVYFEKNTSITGSSEHIVFDKDGNEGEFYRRENGVYKLEVFLEGNLLFETAFELINCPAK